MLLAWLAGVFGGLKKSAVVSDSDESRGTRLRSSRRGSLLDTSTPYLFSFITPNTWKRMVQAKHIAALLIAVCLASTGAATEPLEPPSADGNMTVEARGRAYLFRGLIALIDWGMDELAQRINRAGVTADTRPR